MPLLPWWSCRIYGPSCHDIQRGMAEALQSRFEIREHEPVVAEQCLQPPYITSGNPHFPLPSRDLMEGGSLEMVLVPPWHLFSNVHQNQVGCHQTPRRCAPPRNPQVYSRFWAMHAILQHVYCPAALEILSLDSLSRVVHAFAALPSCWLLDILHPGIHGNWHNTHVALHFCCASVAIVKDKLNEFFWARALNRFIIFIYIYICVCVCARLCCSASMEKHRDTA